MTSDVSEAAALVEGTLDLGMNMLDTADVYGLDWGGAGFGASLRRLGVERIDLWYSTVPTCSATPGDVAETLTRLVAKGKVEAVGVSNHTVAQIDALSAHPPMVWRSPPTRSSTRWRTSTRCATARSTSACATPVCPWPGARGVEGAGRS